MYNKRKFGEHYQELKRLTKELLVAKRKAQETFLHSVLQNEGKCWAQVLKYVKRCKGNRENILAIIGYNDNLITYPTVKSRIRDSKIWSRIPRESDQKMTTLAKTRSTCKRQTHPLVRDSAPHQQTCNCLTEIKIWS
jgi:hypothetical protein